MASAQNPVSHLAVQSGNGQVACICNTATLQQFQSIAVKATDAYFNPVSGATVTWTVTSGQILLPGSATTATSTTDGTGVATITPNLVLIQPYTSASNPYLVSTIQAASNSYTVVFTETQSLVEPSDGASVIAADGPTFNGQNLTAATLSANVGAQLSTPILTRVAGLEQASNGVANVSVRIVNALSSPTLTCASQGGYADPGSVLSVSQGNPNWPEGTAPCYPIFNGSGTSTFSILVGGVPGTTGCTNETTSPPTPSACYLQEFGPYTFTSVAGAPAAVQIVSGNNQVAPVGVLLDPLVAKLVDSNGNAVQGQTMVWSVVPAGAIAIPIGPYVTGNDGEVSISVGLNNLASAGAAITVSLQSNSSISATFQETVLNALTAMNKVGSGDNQTAQVGTNFAAPLVVQLLNANGPVPNYPVQYLVSGPVSLVGSTTVGTNSQGEASITVTAGNLVGTATVTAVAGSLSQVFHLTISSTPTGPQPNGISIVSGNNQVAAISATFAQPLVVQVNSTAGPVSGVAVSFSTTGPVSLSQSSLTTGSNGQVSLTVAAGAASGAATVTATITGGFTATFNLNIAPPGPQISASSFLNAASRQVGQLSPCSLAILSAQGLTPDGATDYTLAPIFGRLPKAVHGLSVTFGGIAAPIVSVAMGATNPEVTLQVPCEVTPGPSVPVVVNVNGGGNASTNIPILTVSPAIFQQVMSDGTSRAVAIRADGTFADIGGNNSYDPDNPVRLGEVVRFYMTGLGATSPSVASDTIEDPDSYIYKVEADVTGTVSLGFVGVNLQVSNVTAHLAPGLIGVYEVNVTIPSSAPTGSNVGFYISIVPSGSSSTVFSPNSTVPIGQ